MNITEDMVKEIILEVLQEMQRDGRSKAVQGKSVPPLQFREVGEAKPGTNRNKLKKTGCGYILHEDLRKLSAHG